MKRPQRSCEVHRYHWPPVQSTDRHHIWPLGMGGPDEPGNTITSCPTGHRNIHRCLDALLNGHPMVGTREEKRLAQRGYDAWVAHGARSVALTSEGLRTSVAPLCTVCVHDPRYPPGNDCPHFVVR